LVPAGCGALALAVVVMVARPASGCGDYASLELFRWVPEAVSTNDVVADRAIKRLRERGPAGLDALLRTHAQTLQRQELPLLTRFAGAEDTELSRLNRALDRVGGQRDCAVSRLYWHTDIEAAKSAAKASGRPILSLRLLGRLDEELSCANSRFFRTALYANAEISAYLREHFVLHWKSVRPVPRMTIDFGDGRKLERTVTGNSIHYICDAEGRPIDALPGLYGPKAFLGALTRAEAAAQRYAALPVETRESFLRAHHRGRLDALMTAWRRDLAQVGAISEARQTAIPVANVNSAQGGRKAVEAASLTTSKSMAEVPLLRSMERGRIGAGKPFEATMDDQTWAKLAALHVGDVRLDAPSLALMRRKHPDAATAARLALSKVRVEDPLVRVAREFERTLSEDTVRNEYLFHAKIHQWFSGAGATTRTMEELNRRVYAELFLTPESDPWLGLRVDGVYSAIEGDGVVLEQMR
jgi:hypothetical protein